MEYINLTVVKCEIFCIIFKNNFTYDNINKIIIINYRRRNVGRTPHFNQFHI